MVKTTDGETHTVGTKAEAKSFGPDATVTHKKTLHLIPVMCRDGIER